MSLSGYAELIFQNTVTGQIRKVNQTNLITNGFYRNLILYDNDSINTGNFHHASGAQIGISQRTTAPDRNQYTLGDMGVNWRAGASFSLNNYSDVNPNVEYQLIENSSVRYQAQFPAPGIGNSRTFDTVFLYFNSGVPAYIPAYLLLASTCTQGDLEILTIFYTLQHLNQAGGDPGYNRTSYRSSFFFRQLWTHTTLLIDVDEYSFTSCPVPDESSYPYNMVALIEPDFQQYSTDLFVPHDPNTVTDSADYFRKRYAISLTTSNLVGLIMRALGSGIPVGHYYGCVWRNLTFTTNSPFQGLFDHNSSSTSFYLDAINQSSGNGTIAFAGSWTKNYPEIYLVEITANGEAGGAATYKWRRRRTFYLQNGITANARLAVSGNLGFSAEYIPGMHNSGYKSLKFRRFTNEEIIFWDNDGITVLNWNTSEYTNYDATTTPALIVTNIGQITTNADITGMTTENYIEGTLIYVGCRNTGLWEVNHSGGTVTQISSDPCYGVDYGYDGKVWAMFDDRLVNSDDYTITGNFTYNDSGFTADRSVCRWIRCDRFNVNSRMCVVRSNQAALQWWDTVNTTPFNGQNFAGDIFNKPEHTLYCDVNSNWWYANSQFNENTFTTSLALTYRSTATANINNDNLFAFLSVHGPSHYMTDGLFHNISGVNNGISHGGIPSLGFGERYGLIPLCPGTALLCTAFATNAGRMFLYSYSGSDDNVLYWQNYGWNGSAWELNHAGSRQVHTTAETLIDSLTVQFTNNGGGSSFVNGDYYTQCMSEGLWKDNATEASMTYDVYSKPVYFNATLSGTVPASAPYETVWPDDTGPSGNFDRAIADTPEYFNITLNGSPVSIITTGSPVAGEVLIAPNLLTWNASDAGKTIGGTYAYINHV